LVGDPHEILPDGARQIVGAERVYPLYRAFLDDVREGLHASLVTRIETLVYPSAPGIREQQGIRLADGGREPDHLGMVGNHEEVQWSDQLYRLAGVGDHHLASRHPIAVVGIERGPDQARIEGEVGVEMRVAEKDLVGIGPAGVG
jgi:hypothetical protein